jgi:hypothetical protein
MLCLSSSGFEAWEVRAVKRREFITLLGSAAAAWPLAARGQQLGRARRIGVLMGYAETDPAAQAQVAALRQELQKLGWDDGRNIRIDVRFPAADAGRVRTILQELMGRHRTYWSPTLTSLPLWFRRKSTQYRLFS